MNTRGVVRYIQNLNIVVNELRDQYQVMSVKSYACDNGNKVEAVIAMSEEMGQRLLSYHGLKLENSCLEVSRVPKCRFGKSCRNIDNDCPFYHDKLGEINNVGVSKTPCWFQNSCPFPGRCKFAHFDESVNQKNGIVSKN